MFKSQRKSKLDRITGYDYIKVNKMNNYTLLNEKYAKNGQIVLYGDSITEIFNWYELFYEFSVKNGLAVYNRGISGDTSDRLYERLSDNVLNIKPSVLVILIGTNDLGLGLDNDFTQNNIEKIITQVKSEIPDCKIIIQSVYPVNKHMSRQSGLMVGKRRNGDIKQLNKRIKETAEKHQCTYLNLFDRLSDENGMLNENYCYDGLHLNAKGYEIAAEEIVKQLSLII